MKVNLYALPGDVEPVAEMTVDDEVQIGDVLRRLDDGEVTRWRVTQLNPIGLEANAVKAT